MNRVKLNHEVGSVYKKSVPAVSSDVEVSILSEVVGCFGIFALVICFAVILQEFYGTEMDIQVAGALYILGEVTEWSNVPVLKTGVR